MLKPVIWDHDKCEARLVYQFDDENPDAPHICIAAWIRGVPQEDPQAAYDAIMAQGALLARAQATLAAAMPDDMKKPRLDTDGDPVIDFFAGRVETVIKDKFAPRATFDTDAGTVTLAIPNLDADTVSALHAAVTEAHGETVEVVRDA